MNVLGNDVTSSSVKNPLAISTIPPPKCIGDEHLSYILYLTCVFSPIENISKYFPRSSTGFVISNNILFLPFFLILKNLAFA